jgi:hypothetical protein
MTKNLFANVAQSPVLLRRFDRGWLQRSSVEPVFVNKYKSMYWCKAFLL